MAENLKSSQVHQMPKNNKGLFITFEGGEGSGKTTLAKRLSHELTKQGHSIVLSREPGGTALGEQIRKWLLEFRADVQPHPKTELMLFLAARAQHLQDLIRPALDQKKIVLCDRFNDSTIAYQGYARGMGIEQIEQLCHYICDGTLPDLTLFLDLDPLTGLSRTKLAHKENASRGQLDRIEKEQIQFHQKVRAGMQILSKKYPERICVIDASQPIEDVFQQAFSLIQKLLATKQLHV